MPPDFDQPTKNPTSQSDPIKLFKPRDYDLLPPGVEFPRDTMSVGITTNGFACTSPNSWFNGSQGEMVYADDCWTQKLNNIHGMATHEMSLFTYRLRREQGYPK